MTLPTNVFTTYEAIGQREDLIDVITNIAPVDTYITSNTGSTVAKARYHEWQTDTLAAAASNVVVEGDNVTAVAVVPTSRAGNYCQILRKAWAVTATEEAVSKAGRSSEMSYQKMKSMKELAKDIEYALLINASAVSGDSATGRQLEGILGWIATNVTSGDSAEPLTETLLNDNLQAIWAQGGTPSTALVGSFQKRLISGFQTNTRNVGAAEQKLVRAVDVYRSDFGEIQIRLHQQLNTSAPSKIVILGDMGLWQKAWLRPITVEQLGKTGPSTVEFAEAELTLESKQEKGSGMILALPTA
jgi:hypothetical protein